eukprot:381989_1
MTAWNLTSFLCGLVVIKLIVSIANSVTFSIETSKSGPQLIDEFLSVTIDAGLVYHWNEFDLNSTLVNTLAKGLSPVYFRYGGTAEDETYIDTNETITGYLQHQKYTLNLTQFSMIADFAQRNNWKLIFGLNAQERFTNNNTW